MSATPERRIPVAKPSFDETEERLVLEVLRSGWVTQGPRVAELEERFAAAVGAPHAIAVSSATTALFLAMHALGIEAGHEVLVPSLTFIASANSVVHTGATPVLVDVDPRTYNLDPDVIEAAITPQTRAVMLVHQLGFPADLPRVQAIADEHGLTVIEDSACAIGSRQGGRPIGASGNVSCWSFHPRKVISTGEGGMITTADGKLAERLRLLRHQGMSVSDLERHHASRVIIEQYPEVGYNFRLSDLQAAVGIGQLAKLDAFLARRRELARRYDEAFASRSAFELPLVPKGSEPNYQSYIVRMRDAERAVRDRLLDAMQARGVATRRGLMAVHREPCYQGARISGSLRHTEEADAQTLVLPLYVGLGDEEQDYVIAQLDDALAEVAPR